MPATNKTSPLIIAGRGIIATEVIAQELRARLIDELGEYYRFLPAVTLIDHARRILAQFEPILAESIAAAEIAAWVAGFDAVAKKLPPAVEQQFLRMIGGGGIPKPPGLILPGFGGEDDEPIVRFPVIERAAKSLLERNILTPDEFARADAATKAGAFTVAGEMSADTLEAIRDVLAETVQQGASLDEFKNRLGPELEGSFIGPAHLETVFRTQTQTAFHDGQDSLADDPIVASVFPYQAYLAINDSRARDTHLALETLGIDGTNIYRRDDLAFWSLFTPAWDFNSVATGELVTTHRGDVPIESVQLGDVVLTHRGRWRPVLGTHRAKGPAELVAIQTTEGRTVRLTAEHRIFTEHGWIEASALHVGQKVYQVKEPTAVDLVRMEIDQRAKSECFPDMTIPVPAWPILHPLDFNAYGNLGQVKIKPERRSGVVEPKVDSFPGQHFHYKPLATRRGHASVDVRIGVQQVCDFPAGDHLGANFRPLRRLVQFGGGGTHRRSIGMPLVVLDVCGADSADRRPARFPNAIERTVNDSGIPGNICQADFTGGIRRDGRIDSARPIGIESLYGLLTISGTSIWLLSHLTPMKVVMVANVQRQLYHGDVHDISVAEDESFVAGGIAISNCRCGTNLLTIAAAARAGVQEAQTWLRTGNEPPLVSRLPFINFRPPAGFGSRRRVAA